MGFVKYLCSVEDSILTTLGTTSNLVGYQLVEGVGSIRTLAEQGRRCCAELESCDSMGLRAKSHCGS